MRICLLASARVGLPFSSSRVEVLPSDDVKERVGGRRRLVYLSTTGRCKAGNRRI
jgi:hypothetical protein